ncbi:hypothetical protein Glove_109g82 [Diversispora epigaea]|uniref:Uncharacterized protein n=1 Tax=Diversispora epigaea TaxID=1348612 RepID=A0A397J6A3_9GLOM|nr:hypothetical protein Glove_109g82 [Diversispora epigaea]
MTAFTKILNSFQPTSFYSTLVKSIFNKKELFDIATSASQFLKDDMNMLGVSFIPAPSEEHIIPIIPDSKIVNFPKEYLLPKINRKILKDEYFDVSKLDGISDDHARTFINKMNQVVVNEGQEGTREALTDTLVNHLLTNALDMDRYPLSIRFHPLCKLSLFDKSYISAEPEFVVSKRSMAMVVVDDKHIKNVGELTNYGETQLACEILACGNANAMDKISDQTIFAMRVISMHVTFYKAVIPKEYWVELYKGFPKKKSVEIMRWPIKNGKRTGLDLADPGGREKVLKSLVKIRQFVLNHVQ